MATSGAHDQFMLFGASIMEQSSTQERGFALAPGLQQTYIRRLDVVNRGHNGYNTDLVLRVLPQVIPDPRQARIRFLVVLFGTNDACFAGAKNGQHVSLKQYTQNLSNIITNSAIKPHNSQILLVTPPPIEERRLLHRVQSQGYDRLNRSNTVIKQYADASRKVAEETGVACVDLWTAFMMTAGWKAGDPLFGYQDLPENEAIRSLIHDGLHFTPMAYKIFHDEIIKTIEKTWADQMPEHLPYVIPVWDDAAAWAKEGLQMGRQDVMRHE